MEGIQCKVVNLEGREVGVIDLDPRVFAAPIRMSLVHQAVRWQRAKKRAGTHAVLNRSRMKGGKKKPWKQKGTGRARCGSVNSPLWPGGAVTHGPQPRDYDFRLTKRARRQALVAVLTDKFRQQSLIVLDKLDLGSAKTREMAAVLSRLGVGKRGVLIALTDRCENVWRSSGNLPKATTVDVTGVNVFDLLKREHLLCTKESVLALQNRLIGDRELGK